MSPLIELIHVRREYDGGKIVAVDDVSLVIGRGETVAIFGPSGSGKSTLLNLMCGLDTPTGGEVRFDGQSIVGRAAWAAIRARRLGLVFQSFCLMARLSARENIELAMLGQVPGAQARGERAASLMRELGLAERAHLRPPLLSGGERQRVAIARALANEPEVLIADEPTGSLDRKSSHSTMDILTGLQRDSHTALVIVTHDPEVAAACSRQIELVDGRIMRTTPAIGPQSADGSLR
jgi:ABC-type lipoprotein export system ATPase subunit